MKDEQPFNAHRILFFSGLLMVLEFVFFHVLQYTTDYLTATLIISFALLGLGLGGFTSPLIKQSENGLFLLCISGCWLCVLSASIGTAIFPFLGVSSLVLAALFFCPGLYLAKMFSTFESPRVYLFDLGGAGMAVLCLTTAYLFLSSEFIILIILVLLSLIGLKAAMGAAHVPKAWTRIFILFLIISGALFINMQLYNSFDLFNLSKRSTHCSNDKSFSRNLYLIKSYDNLISRVEVLAFLKNPGRFYVSLSGYLSDEFNKFPADTRRDARLVTGLLKDPRIYILGPSAQGIVKLARAVTVNQNIDGIEINPAIYRMMTEDFVDESAAPYKGTRIKMGNGIAELKSNPRQYDIITMINTHSTPRISYLGAPDFAHTEGFYKTIFDHLSPHGYLMIEEKPWDDRGRYALYREIITLYQTLKDTGSPNPEEHFFIYTFHLPQHRPYAGLLVQKTPLSSDTAGKIKQWASLQKDLDSIDFPADPKAGQYQKLFTSIKNNRLKIDYPGWDLSILTDDRPFPAAADPHSLQISNFLIRAGIAALLLLMLIGRHSMRGHQHPLLNLKFLFYQACIGLAYMMVENTFMNVYQREFISPSFAFIFTLAPLLMSSAIGGRFFNKASKLWTITALTLLSLLLHRSFIFSLGPFLPFHLRILLIIISIMISGFLMGFFFPAGLMRAKERGLAMNTGHYFAFNCIAGAFAIVFSYYLFVHVGFSLAILLAALLYLVAAGAIHWID